MCCRDHGHDYSENEFLFINQFQISFLEINNGEDYQKQSNLHHKTVDKKSQPNEKIKEPFRVFPSNKRVNQVENTDEQTETANNKNSRCDDYIMEHLCFDEVQINKP